jgi:rare lipoprotein A
MRRVLTISGCCLLIAALAWASDSDRPSPFGPKPNGHTYEKAHPRTVASNTKSDRTPPPEQQRARTAAEAPSSSSFVASGDPETGSATYSGSELDGRPTASGEAFDSTALTAAHPKLPIGSYVRVTNVSTGKSVVVRINDRCRAGSNRVIQVTRRVAEDLGLLGGSSSLTVKVEPVTAAGHAAG